MDTTLFNQKFEYTNHKISIVSKVKKSLGIRIKNMLCYNPSNCLPLFTGDTIELLFSIYKKRPTCIGPVELNCILHSCHKKATFV